MAFVVYLNNKFTLVQVYAKVQAFGRMMEQDLSESYIHLSVADAQSQLAEIVGRVAAEDRRVILSKDSKDLAVIISLEAFWFLEKMIELYSSR